MCIYIYIYIFVTAWWWKFRVFSATSASEGPN